MDWGLILCMPGIFCALENTFVFMYNFDSSKNFTGSSAIYEANTTEAIIRLSEKVVNNIEQPEEMGHASTDVT